MIKAYKAYWIGYIDFGGKTSLGGYWWVVLANYIVSFVVSLFSNMLNYNRPESGVAVSIAFMLLCLPPTLAIMVRRLRDAGLEWTNLFWFLVPIAGPIVLIVKLCKPSTDAEYRPITQQVGANGAPVYQTYSQTQVKPAPVAAPARTPAPPAQNSILNQYRAGLSYLNGCDTFDESKFREFNRITGNRFTESDVQNQLSNAKLMIGGMDDLRKTLQSTMTEAVRTFETLEKSGIDLSAYNL